MNARTGAILSLLLLAAACAAPGEASRERVLQTAIEAGLVACQAALNNPQTQWGPGAQAYCERVVNGCPAP